MRKISESEIRNRKRVPESPAHTEGREDSRFIKMMLQSQDKKRKKQKNIKKWNETRRMQRKNIQVRSENLIQLEGRSVAKTSDYVRRSGVDINLIGIINQNLNQNSFESESGKTLYVSLQLLFQKYHDY